MKKSEKKYLTLISFLALTIFFLQSCSSELQIEKRHYRNGFYVERKNENVSVNDFNVKSSCANSKNEILATGKIIRPDSIYEAKNSFLKSAIISRKNKKAKPVVSKIYFSKKTDLQNVSGKNAKGDSEKAKQAKILGIVSLLCYIILLPAVASAIVPFSIFAISIVLLLAFVLAICAIRRGRQAKQSLKANGDVEGRKNATAGIVLGVLTILSILWSVSMIIIFSLANSLLNISFAFGNFFSGLM